MLQLYGYDRSSASYRVRIALELKGLAYERHELDLLRGEQAADSYQALNPEGLVPLLQDGGHRISQSMAIIEYLEETHPSPPLLPADPLGRARVRAIAQMIACDIHPLNNLRVLRYLIGPMGVSRDKKGDWYAHWVSLGLAQVEKRLSEQSHWRFCHGDQPGLADCFLIPQLANARRMNCDFSGLHRVTEIESRCMALPAFVRAEPRAEG